MLIPVFDMVIDTLTDFVNIRHKEDWMFRALSFCSLKCIFRWDDFSVLTPRLYDWSVSSEHLVFYF